MGLPGSGSLSILDSAGTTKSISRQVYNNATPPRSLDSMGIVAGFTVGGTAMTEFYNYDYDAQLFISAAGITDSTQKAALHKLTSDLKANSLWNKMLAIYPMIGGTAITHKWNLKDPQDTNAAFRITWNGGWTHSSTGALPNGTNAWASTSFLPDSHFDETTYQSLSYYSRTSTADSDEYVMGVAISGARTCALIARRTGDTGYAFLESPTSSYRYASGTITSGNKLIGGDQDGTTVRLYRDGTTVASNTGTGNNNEANIEIVLGAINNGGTKGQWTNKECAFAHIGTSMTTSEWTSFSSAIVTYQTSLSRNV